jgi:shikimate dehydrogenase
MRLFGLIGYPLVQSFSKKYFTEKFAREGIDNCRYELFPLEDIDQLPALWQRYPDLAGLNVTIPYKKQVLNYVDASTLPEGLTAANCLRPRDGIWQAFNSDVVGFEKSLEPLLQPWYTDALLLGNGGATEAVRFVLRKLGIRYRVVSRTLHPGSDTTYDTLRLEEVGNSFLIINCTPLGMFPNVEACPPIPYEAIGERHLLYDLVYNPPLTTFLQKGQEQGAELADLE